MAYKFVDTIEASGTAAPPSEALKLNGEYIEDLIPGYRTLHVAGREALSPEIDYFETGASDGSTRKYKRYPARYITVTYQLLAKTNEAFRDAFNALGGILDVEDAELIFADEPDKYFIGTPSMIGEIEPGNNKVIGQIEFFCADPFKYSVEEYEVEPTLDDGLGFVVNYNGTYKSFPKLEADFFSESDTDGETEKTLTGDGDCGFVAFFNESEKIIQLGDPGEDDGEDMEKSQTLTNQSFVKSTSWGTAAKKLWPVNSGKVYSADDLKQSGTIGLAKPASNIDPDGYYLKPLTYGTGTNYHGPSITRVLPADAAGDKGATNFTFTYKQKTSIGNSKTATKQRGGFQVVLTDASGKVIAGVNVYKNTTGKKANLRFYVNGKIKETVTIDLSYHNEYFGNNTYKNGKLKKQTVKTSSIVKTGSKVAFNVGGIKKTYTDSAIETSAVTQITFTMSQRKTATPLSYNGVYWAKFIKHNCDTWKEVPNKFSTDDIVIADCGTGEIFLNDAPAPELGALGNDWEGFYLAPGINQIGVTYSDWVADAYAPSFKLRYREVYL